MRYAALVLAVLVLSGCAVYEDEAERSYTRDTLGIQKVFTTADVRIITEREHPVTGKPVVCTEPSPDVAKAVSGNFLASFVVNGGTGQVTAMAWPSGYRRSGGRACRANHRPARSARRPLPRLRGLSKRRYRRQRLCADHRPLQPINDDPIPRPGYFRCGRRGNSVHRRRRNRKHPDRPALVTARRPAAGRQTALRVKMPAPSQPYPRQHHRRQRLQPVRRLRLSG